MTVTRNYDVATLFLALVSYIYRCIMDNVAATFYVTITQAS